MENNQFNPLPEDDATLPYREEELAQELAKDSQPDEKTVSERRPLEIIGSLPEDAFAILVDGYFEFILIYGKKNFILGRQNNIHIKEFLVDLSPYEAYKLGVSRTHVRITQETEGYIIEDLGSANGTWLNEMPLPPYSPVSIQPYDEIVLGKLKLTFVYNWAAHQANSAS